MPSEIPAPNPSHEILTSRIIHAPQALVYRAWTEPEHLKVWWGPEGFTNTFNEFDLRVGGRWSFVMHGPEAGHYANECEFTHIEAPFLIAWKRYSKPLFRVVATFEEMATGQTRVTFRQIFDTAADCDKIKPYVVDKNEENMDRLEAELLRMA